MSEPANSLLDQLHRALKHLELPIDEAESTDVDILALLRQFDAEMAEIRDRNRLFASAGELLAQFIFVLDAKYRKSLEEVSRQPKKQEQGAESVPNGLPGQGGPRMSIDAFSQYVRQSFYVDFDKYIQSIPDLPDYPDSRQMNYFRTEPSDSPLAQEILDSVIDDCSQLLDTLPDKDEAAKLAGIKELSHGEEIQLWSNELRSLMPTLQKRKKKCVSLVDLIYSLKYARSQGSYKSCFTEVWLAFLLGDHSYQLRRRADDFYSPIGIEVVERKPEMFIKILSLLFKLKWVDTALTSDSLLSLFIISCLVGEQEHK